MALTDKVYLSAGLSHKRRDGFEYNETTGNDDNDLNLTTGCIALRFEPIDKLDIILRGDISHQDQKGNPRHNNFDTSSNGGIHSDSINPDTSDVNAYIHGEVKRRSVA